MLLLVEKPFVGFGFNMPNPGELIDPPEDVANQIISMGLARRYETKIVPPPAEVKKNEPSASSRPAPRPRKKTRRKSKKSAKKS